VRILSRGSLISFLAPIAVLFFWELASRTFLAGSYALPAPTQIAARAISDFEFVWPNLVTTARESALGWFWGNFIAVVAAAVFIVFRPAEVLLFRVFVALYCLPVVALAPILGAILDEGQAQVVISAQAVFFTTLIAVMLGLKSATPESLDLVRVSGGRGFKQLAFVRLHQALPSFFSGLRIAAPASVLGAVIGEYLGARLGLGVAMVYSQQSLDITRTWGLALYTTLLAGLFYLLTVLAERILVPWMQHTVGIQPLPKPTQHSGNMLRRFALSLGSAVASLTLIVVVWWSAVELSGLSNYFMKTPLDVIDYLFLHREAGENRALLFASLGITLRDTLLGYVAGTIAAVVISVFMSVSVTVRRIVTPFAVAMRAIPLVAMAPLFVLLFGRGIEVVIFIAGLVTFFPTLIQLTTAMARTPSAARDLVKVNGGGVWQTAGRVMLPSALPALLASARIAAPTAMLGALLSEWLATGEGLGSEMLRAQAGAGFSFIWASVAVITLSAFGLYAIATVAESLALRRLGG
jgi:sulfonate transport system permease protein